MDRIVQKPASSDFKILDIAVSSKEKQSKGPISEVMYKLEPCRPRAS